MSGPAFARPEAVRTKIGNREYVHPGTGQVVPSVTSILQVLNKPALPRWAAKMVAEAAVLTDDWADLPTEAAQIDALKKVPWATRDKAANIGSSAHAYAEQVLRTGSQATPAFMPPELGRAAEGVRLIVNDLRPQALYVEVTVWSEKFAYAGALDGIYKVGDETWLIDWKSGKGVYSETALQMSAYRYADFIILKDGAELPLPHIDQCKILHVPQAGDLRPGIWDVATGVPEFKAFLAARRLFDWVQTENAVALERGY